MARVLLRLVTAVVMIGLLLVPALATMSDPSDGAVADPVTITEYRADYDVADDGTLTATETITADFPFGRHGIFRYWDLADFADSGVRYRPHDVSIRLDGEPVPVSAYWEQGRRFRVAQIGDADSYLTPGSHTYTIKYRIDGVLAPNPDRLAGSSASWTGGEADRSEFVWQVVAAGWSMPIRAADLRVTLPHRADRLECSIGDGRTCTVAGEGTRTLRITASGLPPNTPVVLRAAMDAPAPDRAHVPWSIGWDRALGSSVTPFLIVVLLSLVALAVGYLIDRSTRERSPGLPVLYEPPQGLGPVQTAYVVDERVPKRALTATLMHLAEQGHVTLHENDGNWTVKGTLAGDAWDTLDPVARHVVSGLGLRGPNGPTFKANGSVKSGQRLQRTQGAIAGVTREWAISSGAVVPARREWVWRILFAVAVVIVAAGSIVGVPGLYLMPFAAFAIGSVGVLLPGVGSRRTKHGRELWSRAGGFERFLTTDAARDRFDFSGREQLYTAYIPYAVAFDAAHRWARKYEVSTGQPAPVPLWYGTGVGYAGASHAASGGDPFTSFEKAVSSSISAYTATQASSSSSGGGGGGGGGFSGGGGGGGGGGSW
ncbi:DUF2207 domain-containing protein [Aeromicrobium duanguangcaii]|uniref:DUF2207 domain-containing protein n=1 Tax=Aeromicrobium duanguangcaii TaxID=2968086 RepID=A0ABY5KCF4_9ACTN|nr:DUF2207 domain-containing protein [Aeromicrobium duanguangcaii]MCD9155036.1 DUF2207 domain-containing protein [Aeromicrobium duanguangcaii]UUI67560.1 DUF2207 domain-containing protein [Aeromicrobium duanguangcaii]